MKYLDTNILVRLITGDDHVLRQKAVELIESAGKEELFIDNTVLVELCFVLEFQVYKMMRDDICGAIRDVMTLSQITYDPSLTKIIDLYGQYQKLDFTDCALLVLSQSNVVTFDKDILTLQK